MTPIFANGGGLTAGFGFALLSLLVVVGLTPVSALVNWLKGKKKTSVALLLVGAAVGFTWVTNDFWWLVDSTVILAFPVSLFGLVSALRIAKPGSWWFNRFYVEGKRQRATWGFSTSEGRKYRRRTAVIAGLSVVVGLVGGVFVVNGVEDLLTTSWDEVHTQVSLYLLAEDFDDLEALAARARDEGVDVRIESRYADLGPRALSLLQSEIFGCVWWSAVDAVHITISPPEEERVDEVLRRIGPVSGLVVVSSEMGDVEGALAMAPLQETGDHGFPCDAVEITAYLDPLASDSERRELAESIRDWPGVLAVAEPVWRREERSFKEYQALAACYGPREMRVFVSNDAAETAGSLIDVLKSWPIVETAASEFEGEEEGFQGLELPLCDSHYAHVSLNPQITEAQAAVVVAEARQVPGVANVEYEPPQSEFGCEECLHEGTITVIRGDLEVATLEAVGEAVCQLPGVLGIEGRGGGESPCPPQWIEVRLATSSKDQVDVVIDILGSHPAVYMVDVGERSEHAVKPETVVGSRDHEVCSEDAEYLWRVRARLVRDADGTMDDLIGSIRGLGGVIIVGTAVGVVPDDPDICGHGLLRYWLTPEVSPSERAAVFAVMESFGVVLAADIMEDRSDVGTDDEVSVEVGWSGTVYFEEFDLAAAEDVRSALAAMEGVAYAEVADWLAEEYLP